MASAAALSDELAEQILLRFPADDPARLVRAALACKRARRLVADPGFRRRFREFHGAAPMLGFFLNAGVVSVRAAGGGRRWFPLDSERELSAVVRFVPTSPSSCLPRAFDLRDWRVVDARHGRVLLHSWTEWGNTRLVVWDPITDERRGLPMMPVSLYPDNWNAAVLCSAAGCNHLDCHGKRFTVVFVAIKEMKVVDYTFSTEDDLWSWPPNPGAQQHDEDGHLHLEPSALVGNKLYFVLQPNTEILEYNVGTRETALIQLPLDCSSEQRTVLMTMEDGGLGVATVRKSKLCLWSREIDSDEDGGWAQRRVIDLKTLLRIRSLSTSPVVAGFANGIGVIFVQTSGALFMIDLKSSRVKKVRKVNVGSNIFPYMSFCYPALGGVSKGEGSSVASSAGPCGNGTQGGDEGCDIGGGEHSHDHSSDDEATASDEDDDDSSWATASDEDDDDDCSWATVSNEEDDDDSEAMTSDEDDYEDDDCAYLASLLLFMLVTEGELP